MKTSRQQIEQAKRAYIVELTDRPNSMRDRFSIYLDAGEGLQILWADYSFKKSKDNELLSEIVINKKDLLDYQVHTNNRKYPAFHFVLNGGNYGKEHALGQMLREINPSIEVFTINGHSPSPVSL